MARAASLVLAFRALDGWLAIQLEHRDFARNVNAFSGLVGKSLEIPYAIDNCGERLWQLMFGPRAEEIAPEVQVGD